MSRFWKLKIHGNPKTQQNYPVIPGLSPILGITGTLWQNLASCSVNDRKPPVFKEWIKKLIDSCKSNHKPIEKSATIMQKCHSKTIKPELVSIKKNSSYYIQFINFDSA